MWFWVFMLIINLLIPLFMLGFGLAFFRGAPKEINRVFGYRTKMSMKNKETWEFAHRHCGKNWLRVGASLLVISVIAMVFLYGHSEETIGTYGGVICLIQLVPLIGSIIPTEIALRARFDEEGRRKRDD